MALQESVEKFRKQQLKCLSMTHSAASAQQALAKTSTPLKTSSNVHKATPANVHSSWSLQPPAPTGKFSNDTERLQMIHNIRKSPVGAQIKRVIGLLLERREALTPDQINDACYVDVNTNKAVFESLTNNPKVFYDGNCFSYKAKHGVKNKEELLVLIRKFPEGMRVIDLKDAYPNVMEDLQILKALRKVWLLSNNDSQEDIVYPNDPRVLIKVDDDLKKHFWSFKLPDDMLDIEKYLQKNGMKPATNTARRRAAAQIQGISTKTKPKKKHGISKRMRITNAHLPELFQSLKSQ